MNGTDQNNNVINTNNINNPNVDSNGIPNVIKTPVVDANTQNILNKQPVVNTTKEAENTSGDNQRGGPNKIKTFFAIILFIFFFALVYFLPEITDYINMKKSERNQEKITSGTMICTEKKNTKTLDINITVSVNFINNEVTSITHTQTSMGDKNEDKEELEKLRQSCSTLKGYTKDLEGISVVCGLNNGVATTKQIINFEKLGKGNVSTAYTEAGGIYPTFKKGDTISTIESKMKGYKCEKRSS